MTEASYTKLFSSITDSTIWCEDSDTRIVWITMLAMSDNNGWVYASIPGLANRAQVSISSVKKAIDKFLSPDKYSRTPDNEGRRIEVIDGGWALLNHPKYRAIRSAEERREYQRRWMANKRKAEKEASNVDSVVDKVESSIPQCTNTDTDTDKTIEQKFDKFWHVCPKRVDRKKAFIAFKNLSGKKQDLAIEDIATRYADTEKRFIPNPTTYLHGERWNDERESTTLKSSYSEGLL